jgi:hypothetical protein
MISHIQYRTQYDKIVLQCLRLTSLFIFCVTGIFCKPFNLINEGALLLKVKSNKKYEKPIVFSMFDVNG